MDTNLTRTAEMPAAALPKQRASAWKTLLRRVSAVAYRLALRLPSLRRDAPVDYYRFPPF